MYTDLMFQYKSITMCPPAYHHNVPMYSFQSELDLNAFNNVIVPHLVQSIFTVVLI